ncbi:MAG: Eco57I restriction-modification methylase domain-containing protein, partial [Anaerolinea sp.]|nr:Eco57I restriction-modification methylase domain-containing protein [Anaerolinea sp.]
AAGFQAQFDPQGRLNAAKALLADWRSVDLLQQITADELGPALSGQGQLFQNTAVDGADIQSYLFFAVDLAGAAYTRTQLAAATREINKLFPMPALVIFRHGASLTFAIIARRVHKRDASRDVLEKVTLIREIRCANPHRAHVEILEDLALPSLAKKQPIATFVDLQRAWETTLDTSELNKKFFREVANWYFWAVQTVVFPDPHPSGSPLPLGEGPGVRENHHAISVIRLITRLIFVWFIREKGLAPAELFDRDALQPLLRWNDPQGSTYYKAILQNLFFATLNSEMGEDRRFRGKNPAGRDSHYGIPSVYRYQDYFTDPAAALRLFASIPFLNGGLFECLDRPGQQVRIDGFSDRADNPLVVPDFLFFGGEQEVDLNDVFGTRNRRYQARGLLRIFDSYKFTIEENTPIEEEIALDPELLGKVFENLLAAHNPETGVTARKQTGSFYTPREIVDYMVDESLLAYLETALGQGAGKKFNFSEKLNFSERLRGLLAYSDEPHGFDAAESAALIAAIDRLKCLDPACGSGAFPMGMLHKLVHVLARLDPDNSQWRALQRRKAVAETEEAYQIGDRAERKTRLDDIEEAFTANTSDYGRKLYLIENCIYGVDIQPIAVQIAKLRFFISLVVDQRVDDARPNRGVRPLPNLETKFVAANTLIGIPRPQQMALRDPAIEQKERDLAEVRKRHFAARTQTTKEKYRQADQRLRGELAALLRRDGWGRDTAAQLAAWDPYDQNAHADFFDPEWMFGVAEGFDVVIGNPPYVRQEQLGAAKALFQQQYDCYTGTADLYVYFFERGLRLLRPDGVLTYISSNKYFRAGYGAKLRGYLAGQTRIEQLIDFGDAPVFTAIAYPSILIARRAAPAGQQTRALSWPAGEPLTDFAGAFRQRSFLIAQRELTADGWRLETPAVLRLMEKLHSRGRPLGEFVNGQFYRGITTGLNDAFVVDQSTCDRLIAEHSSSARLLRPFLRGRDIERWRVRYDNQYLIKIESSENKTHGWSGMSKSDAEAVFAATYPAIHGHLLQSRDALIARDDQGHYFWELRSCTYWHEFERHKIVSTKVSKRPTFAFDNDGYFFGNTSYFKGTETNPLFILGLLNSNVSFYYARKVFVGKQNSWYEVQPVALEAFPLPPYDDTQMIDGLVKAILAAKAENPAADVRALEAEIDQRVYALYGLTAEEIRIVEGETR